MSPELLDSVLLRTDFPELHLHASGKVRDVYQVDNESLLFVATDRISAFDYILATGIPHKGRVLTQISLFWFDFLSGIVPNHVITADVDHYPHTARKYADQLRGRSMLVRRAEMFPGGVRGARLRFRLGVEGIQSYRHASAESNCRRDCASLTRYPNPSSLPRPKRSPATMRTFRSSRCARSLASKLPAQLRDLSLKIYSKAAAFARARGIIIADTKFEFGRTAKGITLADEVLTPDSSRFWPADKYEAGRAQESFDKQYVRDYLEQIRWNKQPPAPALPQEVARATSEKYTEAYFQLTGRKLDV